MGDRDIGMGDRDVGMGDRDASEQVIAMLVTGDRDESDSVIAIAWNLQEAALTKKTEVIAEIAEELVTLKKSPGDA